MQTVQGIKNSSKDVINFFFKRKILTTKVKIKSKIILITQPFPGNGAKNLALPSAGESHK